MKSFKYYYLVIFNLTFASAYGQNKCMTMADVDSAVVRHNLQLRTSRLNIDAAEGQLAQARKYENPEVQLMHNIQNPVNKRWFDTGYEGQTDIQVSQPIAIGGQHRSRVKQAKAALDACMAEYESEKLDVKSNVHNIFIDLYYTQQKLKVYDKEIASLEKIYHAYEQQSEKGNVSKMQLFRISAMISELCAEQASLMMTRADLQKELNLHINMSEDSQIVVEMDEEDMLRYVTNTLAKLTPFVTHQDKNSLSALLKQHPVMAQMAYQQKNSHEAVKIEKAEALPHITLNGEWDKNGSIGHNFFAVGATVSIPLWNRNRGNIRTAKAKYAQSVLEREVKEKELMETVMMHYNTTKVMLKLVEDLQDKLSTDLDQLLTAAEDQFMKQHISVIEFVDLYGSFRETLFQLADSKAQLMKSNEELNKYIIG